MAIVSQFIYLFFNAIYLEFIELRIESYLSVNVRSQGLTINGQGYVQVQFGFGVPKEL